MATINSERNIALRNALDNLLPHSGASDEYCAGLVVGLVSGMMAEGQTYRAALAAIRTNWKPAYRRSAVPSSWQRDMGYELFIRKD